MKLIELNIEKIIELCKKLHVRKLWVFGSILTNRFNDKSDIDLCVDFDKNKVDITDDSAVRNPYFREEPNEKRRLIYG